MGTIHVLIVDDSVVTRRILVEGLSGDPALVVTTAANGRIALAKLSQVSPDVVILDMEMPEMDGLETLKAIRMTYPRLPVIMFSRFTQRGAAATVEALTLGASDYLAKPENAECTAGAVSFLREQLIPKIKQFAPRRTGSAPGSVVLPPAVVKGRPSAPGVSPSVRPVGIVAIGVSTGGPNALAEILPHLPVDFPVPVVIVQHMPPLFTRKLADRLASRSAIGVREGVEREPLLPGHAWVAPGDYHMIVARDASGVARLQLHQEPPQHSCRPSVDVLFRSVAQAYGSATLALVLTGMGTDGVQGCAMIHEAGGKVLAQDEASSVVWGMPGGVVRAGLAEEVLPLDRIGPELVRRLRKALSPSSAGLRPA